MVDRAREIVQGYAPLKVTLRQVMYRLASESVLPHTPPSQAIGRTARHSVRTTGGEVAEVCSAGQPWSRRWLYSAAVQPQLIIDGRDLRPCFRSAHDLLLSCWPLSALVIIERPSTARGRALNSLG
ncbi:hypothetical protein GCM10010317_104060 [Streptomyces mirabilis]|nr:hypothetical protein GCM10010317_104060 [Streptomyces mirabilis]